MAPTALVVLPPFPITAAFRPLVDYEMARIRCQLTELYLGQTISLASFKFGDHHQPTNWPTHLSTERVSVVDVDVTDRRPEAPALLRLRFRRPDQPDRLCGIQALVGHGYFALLATLRAAVLTDLYDRNLYYLTKV